MASMSSEAPRDLCAISSRELNDEDGSHGNHTALRIAARSRLLPSHGPQQPGLSPPQAQ